MKFLCIHGACTNPETMKLSLNPFLKQISNDENITFHYAQGFLDSQPPPWLEETLDGPPHLKFLQWDTNLLDVWHEADVRRDSARGTESDWWATTGEERDRVEKMLYSQLIDHSPEPWSVVMALEYLHNIMEDEGPFDGVMGVSEGASLAATLLIEDMQACKARNTQSSFRCGIFFIGAPAWQADGTKPWMAEEHGQVIDVPTCHIMGTKDVLRIGAEALLKVCDADKTLVISDPGGHRIPQDFETNKRVADWIRERERERERESLEG